MVVGDEEGYFDEDGEWVAVAPFGWLTPATEDTPPLRAGFDYLVSMDFWGDLGS